MSAHDITASFPMRSASSGLLSALVDEIRTTAIAMLRPGRVIAEVEQMQQLRREADRIEHSHPVRAAMLRRQAARVGLH